MRTSRRICSAPRLQKLKISSAVLVLVWHRFQQLENAGLSLSAPDSLKNEELTAKVETRRALPPFSAPDFLLSAGTSSISVTPEYVIIFTSIHVNSGKPAAGLL